MINAPGHEPPLASLVLWSAYGAPSLEMAAVLHVKAKSILLAALAVCSPILSPAAQLQILHDFGWAPMDGSKPGQLVIDGSGIYGTLNQGGEHFQGAVYHVGLDGSGYELIHSFNTPGGTAPDRLTLVGSALYGTTYYTSSGSGTNFQGTLFTLQKDGSGYQFLATLPTVPSDIAVVGNTIYGSSIGGGANNLGSAFRLNLNGSGYSLLHDFDVQGAQPWGSMISAGGKLYGVTHQNGLYFNAGTLYRMDSDGSNYTRLHLFGAGQDGTSPAGGLTLVGAQLFGTTATGGAFGFGTVFRIDLDGGGYSVLHNFRGDATEGSAPFGALQAVGDTLYGVTGGGTPGSPGTSGAATVFKLALDGSDFAELYRFTNYFPSANFVVANDTLYGVTSAFGSSGSLYTVAIPEPATGALLGCAAFGLLLRLSGRRHYSARRNARPF